MTEQTNETDNEALKSWYTTVLNTMVKEMIKTGAVTGTAVEARPIWVSPYKVLIAKVWDVSQKSNFIWAISGDNVITDHIAGSMAVTPKEVARHFSLKWQMDADRLLSLAKNQTPIENAKTHMEPYTEKLIQCAEYLYDFTDRDDVWLQRPTAK